MKKKKCVFGTFCYRKAFLFVLDKYRVEDLLDKPPDRQAPAYIRHEMPLMAAKHDWNVAFVMKGEDSLTLSDRNIDMEWS